MACYPLRAIVVASGDPNSPPVAVAFDQIVDGVNLNGVVRLVTSGGIGCSGSLLADGYSILTAGHCITGSYGSSVPDYVTVYFPGPSGLTTDTATNYIVDPLWTGDSSQGGDLAMLRLNQAAPSSATRYSLYTGIFTTSPILLAGFGQTGTGTTGASGGSGTLRQGQNRYDALGGDVFAGWSNKMLLGDFDNGTTTNNALGTTDADIPNEVDIAFGDSGGPAFYGGLLIGVHDLIACYSESSTSPCLVPPSVSESDRSYFGQLFADTGISANASWIESELVPEPASGALVLLGLVAAGFLGRRTGCRPS